MTPVDPVLTVLTVAGEPEAARRTYASLVEQTDRRWEWCLAGVAGTDPRAEADLPLDPRIASVVGALPAAFEVATGRHVMVLEAGDLLDPESVEEVAGVLPAAGWGYADERHGRSAGRRDQVWRKPAWAPELLRSQPYPGRSAFLPRQVLADLGGLRPEAASAAWYDAVLRVSEVAGEAVHVRRPLVVRPDPDPATLLVPGAPADHVRAVRDHCRRTGIDVDDVSPLSVGAVPVGQRLRRTQRRRHAVSIVIPTRGSASVVRGARRTHVSALARSLVAADDSAELELVVVHDDVTPDEVLAELREVVGDRLTLVRYEGWFDFSRKCNLGALVARGEYLCFLNDDMEVVAPDWLAEMVQLLEDPGVGAVGARLLFEDGTLQHAGHVYTRGDAGHALFGWDAATLAQGGIAQLTGERSGVTAACMLVRAADFRRVGAFSPEFPLNYNDVDLCLKLREMGFRVLYTPFAVLDHFESQTRDARILPSEREQLHRRWWVRMRREAYVQHDEGES